MKIVKFWLGIIFIFTLASCQFNDEKKVTMLIPLGSPLLGMSDFIVQNPQIIVEKVPGASLLSSGFINKSYDFIVAPVSLGAKFYNSDGGYQLLKVLVWGNYHLASLNEFSDLSALNGSNVCIFGASTTPDLMMKAVLDAKNIVDYNVTYVDDVATSMMMLLSGACEYALVAEPSFSAASVSTKIYSLDLQELFKEVSGVSLPQAGIFVNKKTVNNLNELINDMVATLQILDVTKVVSAAPIVDESFQKMDVKVLEEAFLRSHIEVVDNILQKRRVDDYLNYLVSNGYADQIGKKVCDEGFYY